MWMWKEVVAVLVIELMYCLFLGLLLVWEMMLVLEYLVVLPIPESLLVPAIAVQVLPNCS